MRARDERPVEHQVDGDVVHCVVGVDEAVERPVPCADCERSADVACAVSCRDLTAEGVRLGGRELQLRGALIQVVDDAAARQDPPGTRVHVGAQAEVFPGVHHDRLVGRHDAAPDRREGDELRELRPREPRDTELRVAANALTGQDVRDRSGQTGPLCGGRPGGGGRQLRGAGECAVPGEVRRDRDDLPASSPGSRRHPP